MGAISTTREPSERFISNRSGRNGEQCDDSFYAPACPISVFQFGSLGCWWRRQWHGWFERVNCGAAVGQPKTQLQTSRIWLFVNPSGIALKMVCRTE